jgi:hypothetical protein
MPRKVLMKTFEHDIERSILSPGDAKTEGCAKWPIQLNLDLVSPKFKF